MKALKIIAICLLTFTAVSCQINLNRVNGNGNVVTEERNVREFDRVKGSAGLQVILTEGTENKVVVEADENLMEIIETYVDDGMLRIGVDGNIGRSSSKRVYVTYKTSLNEVRASSGSHVIVKNEIKSEDLTLDASSGAMLEASVFSKNLYLEASSGANVDVTGKAKDVRSKASSGAYINAENLLSATCNARASSGGHIKVNVKDNLEAKASSGGQIDYYGDPSVKSSSKNFSGDVRKM